VGVKIVDCDQCGRHIREGDYCACDSCYQALKSKCADQEKRIAEYNRQHPREKPQEEPCSDDAAAAYMRECIADFLAEYNRQHPREKPEQTPDCDPGRYSPERAVEYFTARIEENKWLKDLGYMAELTWCGNHIRGLNTVSLPNAPAQYPNVYIQENTLSVNMWDGTSSQVYSGISLIAAWNAFLAAVKPVYPQMCIDWLKQQRPDVEWLDTGQAIFNRGSRMVFDYGENRIIPDYYSLGWRGTIADFLAEYNRQHPKKKV
jgi:hypothetical protein